MWLFPGEDITCWTYIKIDETPVVKVTQLSATKTTVLS